MGNDSLKLVLLGTEPRALITALSLKALNPEPNNPNLKALNPKTLNPKPKNLKTKKT